MKGSLLFVINTSETSTVSMLIVESTAILGSPAGEEPRRHDARSDELSPMPALLVRVNQADYGNSP
jgi:hypothetical protein